MPAIAEALVRRQKEMTICLQARQHTLTLRGKLRFPRTMFTEADTCRKRPVLKLRMAGLIGSFGKETVQLAVRHTGSWLKSVYRGRGKL
jgi:hypothetical protein